MKWRSVLIYFIAFVLLGGYFYYFEVFKAKKEAKTKEEEKKIFSFSYDNVKEVRVFKSSESIFISRDQDRWIIKNPVETEADSSSIKALINVMADMKAKKWIPEEKDLSPFGLDKPSLKIEVVLSDKTYRLDVGHKNPTEDGYFARAFIDGAFLGKEPVFIFGDHLFGVLNKGLYELRKKELASFENPQVRKIKIEWHGDQRDIIEITREGEKWQSPKDPTFKVKKSKVDHILDQIRWLRAQKFLDKEKDIENPSVTLSLELSGDRVLTLKFEEIQKVSQEETPKSIKAISSELPFVVLVDEYAFKELPRSLASLEDRSVFSWEEGEIQKISWNLGGDEKGECIRDDKKKDNWKIARGENKDFKNMKESWRVRAFLWDVSEMEFENKFATENYERASRTVSFYGADDKLLAEWTWQAEDSNSASNTIKLLVKEGDGKIQVFTVSSSKLKNLEEKIKNFL